MSESKFPLVFDGKIQNREVTVFYYTKTSGDECGIIAGVITRVSYSKNNKATEISYKDLIGYETVKKYTVPDATIEEHNAFAKAIHDHMGSNAFVEKL